MPKLYKATFTVYFTAHDLDTAKKFAPLKCNRITSAIKDNSWIQDTKSVAIFNEGSVVEVSNNEHAKALSWKPSKACWNDLSPSLINHLAGV